MTTTASKVSESKRGDDAPSTNRQKYIESLRIAYRMELETVANYLANSVFLDGLRAEEVKSALAEDVPAELNHARQLAQRIKQLGGRVPGSLELKFDQNELQPPDASTDLRTVVEGVIEAERAAIEHYRSIIRATDGEDFVTQDLCIKLQADEEEHRVQFEGFLKELDAEK